MSDKRGRGSGEWLRRRRVGRGWTQIDLSRESGVNQSTVSRLEAGSKHLENVTLDTVAALAAVFGEPISDLLIAAGVEQFGGLEPAVVQAAYTMQRLSQEHRDAVIAFIESQASQETHGS